MREFGANILSKITVHRRKKIRRKHTRLHKEKEDVKRRGLQHSQEKSDYIFRVRLSLPFLPARTEKTRASKPNVCFGGGRVATALRRRLTKKFNSRQVCRHVHKSMYVIEVVVLPIFLHR